MKLLRYFTMIAAATTSLSVTGCGGSSSNPSGFSGDTFLVMGDSRSGDAIYKTIVNTIASSFSSSDCLVHTGDMIVTPGKRKQWTSFMDITAPVAAVMPWYGVVGNHDVDSIVSQQMYQDVMNLPGNELYYSFDRLNCHFIVLDTMIPGQEWGITGAQLAWLRNDLEAYAASAQYLFVFTHRTLFPQGSKAGLNLSNADELHQLFQQHGVNMVFSGDEHEYYTYKRDSITYVVTGGGGAPLATGGFNHFLVVELLPPGSILIHVMDVNGNPLQTASVSNM